MTKEIFTGICVRGPYDGFRLAHYARSKKFYRPMVAYHPLRMDSAPVEAVEIGSYNLNDFGQWHWWETESGRAFERLFGHAHA